MILKTNSESNYEKTLSLGYQGEPGWFIHTPYTIHRTEVHTLPLAKQTQGLRRAV